MAEQNNNINTDEFDIELMAQKLYHIGMKALNKLLYPVKVLSRKPVRFIAFMIASVFAAVILKYTYPPVYKSSFLIKPMYPADLSFIDILYDIDQLVQNNDRKALSFTLGIDEQTSDAIRSVAIDPVWRSPRKDTVTYASISIKCSDPLLFDSIQNHILRYLDNNEHYARIRQMRMNEVALMKAKITNDLREIDSLKHMLAQNIAPRNAGGFVYGAPIDPVKTYDEAMALYRQELSLNWQAEFNDTFELLKGCIPTQKPYFPKFSLLLIVCCSLGIILCFVYNYHKL
jgi:hypothetical protein